MRACRGVFFFLSSPQRTNQQTNIRPPAQIASAPLEVHATTAATCTHPKVEQPPRMANAAKAGHPLTL